MKQKSFIKCVISYLTVGVILAAQFAASFYMPEIAAFDAHVKRPAVPPVLDLPLANATDVVIKSEPDTFANPINISYQIQHDYRGRESADPAGIMFKGEYYLFASHGSGYWWSENMLDWNYIYAGDTDSLTAPDRSWSEIEMFAPALCVIGDYLYITHSEGGSIFRTNDPKNPDAWEYVGRPHGWSDPALFYDQDTGRAFCYYGLSATDAIRVVELDPNNNMALISGPHDIVWHNPDVNGFELSGHNNDDYGRPPIMEGPWVTKHNGTYYLQYAIPDTAVSSYANGVYISDNPLGPFEYTDYSPFSSKYTGFIRGAGHGSLMEDAFGNWWSLQTVALSVNTGFERRLSITPAQFTDCGMLISHSAMSEYPYYIPEIAERSYDAPGPEWNLVSYGASATASSTLNGGRSPGNAFDENIRTWWSAATGSGGEWLQADLGKLTAVNALQINFAEQDVPRDQDLPGEERVSGRNNNYCHRYLLEFSIDGTNWHTLVDQSDAVAHPNMAQDYTHPYFELAKTIGVRYIRITNKGQVPANGKFAISDIRLFGDGQGQAPAAGANDFAVNRHSHDERRVTVSWSPVDRAEGYIVRYGVNKDILNLSRQIIGAESADIRNLTKGIGYWFIVDSYNDSGITKGAEAKYVGWQAPLPDRRPFLRAWVNNLYTGTLMDTANVPEEIGFGGAIVQDFTDGSYAQALGFRKNDVITKVNGAVVQDTESLIELYDDIADGETVQLTVWRRSRYVNIDFTKDISNSYLNVPCIIQAEDYDDIRQREVVDGVMRPNIGYSNGNRIVEWLSNGDWILYKNINFTSIPDYVTIRAGKDVGTETISVRLGSPTGTVIASVVITGTGNWHTYANFRADITVPIQEGVYDVYLTYSGGINTDWFSFNMADQDGYDETYEAVRFSAIEGVHVSAGDPSPGDLYADWRDLDGGVPADLTKHDPSKLYLRANLHLAADVSGRDLSGAFSIGSIKLRSPDAAKNNDPDGSDNREHNFGWNISALPELKLGDNYINIPLESALNGEFTSANNRRGIMDWTQVGRMILIINSVSAYSDVNFTMTLSDVKIVNITFEEELERLRDMTTADEIPRGDYTPSSHNHYLSMLEFARQELTHAHMLEDIRYAISQLQAAIDNLEPDSTIGIVRGDVNLDGIINIFDMLYVRDHILNRITLTETSSIAADMDRDGHITVNDILRIRDYILGKR